MKWTLSTRYALAITLLTLIAPGATLSSRAEIIRSFDSEIHLQKDTTLDITETILMDFESSERHGIFRIMPVKYNRGAKGQFSTQVKLLAVTDENGSNLKYKATYSGSDLNIKIGDPNVTMSGEHTYKIHYTVRRAVTFPDNTPEVYWNVTGSDWPFWMERVSARFYPPEGVKIKDIKTASYKGPPGSTQPGRIDPQADSILYSTSNMKPGDNLTMVAGLPAGSVVPPTFMQNLVWILTDWWPAIFFPLIAFLFLITKYMTGGRDAEGGLPVAVEWNPPTSLSPAEVGTLVDEKCDMADIVSTLIDLAARGYLIIEETTSEKILFFSNKDYIFHKVEPIPPLNVLQPHELAFYNGLFGVSSRVTLSSLKNSFYTKLPSIREGIMTSLMKKNLFTSNPENTRAGYIAVGVICGFIGFFLTMMLIESGKYPWGLGLLGTGILFCLFAKAMPAKTATGSRMLRECLGFQRYVSMAEKDRIRVLAAEDPTIFGRLLPYAMVLGVADQWADAFKDLLTEPPSWYMGSTYNTWSPHMFVNDLGSGMNSMGSTFASQPKSSGSGSSGFSGGSSGGGFGGGGGGSW